MVEKTSFEKLKEAIIDIKNYYPDGIVYGKLEAYFEGRGYVLDLLIHHEIFELIPQSQIDILPISNEEKRQRWYRLAKRGVDLAISMIHLESNEEMKKYSLEMRRFTIVMGVIGALALIIGIDTLIFQILQYLS